MDKNVKRDDFLMKFLPKDLKDEFDRLTRYHPDIPGLDHPLLNLSDAFRAYLILAHYFMDESSSDDAERMLVGVRSVDLLASALGRQNVSFGGQTKYDQPLDICATLFYGIVKNHAFSDGNKRTGLLLLLYQLDLYGYMPKASKKDFEKLVLCVADNSLPIKYRNVYKKFKKEADKDAPVRTISYLLKSMVAKKDSSYHLSPSMKEFCAAIEKSGGKYELDNGKIKFSYRPSSTMGVFKARERKYSTNFKGWTRTVGAGTAKEILQNLGLRDQYPTYDSFLNGEEPLYALVDNFKEPLKRLKDE